jgi:hypothetical protein
MKQIIQNIQDRLVQEVPALEYVDQDWGQMDFFPDPPVEYPCALIDIQSAQYTHTGNFIQQGTLTVVIRLFDLKISDITTQNVQKIWQLIEDVNKALHGQNFLEEGYGLLVREQMRRTKRRDGYYQTELYYSVQFTDVSCEPELIPVSPVKAELKTGGF